MKLAFMDAVFPGLTSTFVNREFEYLREQTDLDVRSITVKRPGKDLLNEEYKHYAKIAKYLRPDSLAPIFLFNLLALITRPRCYFKVLRVVLGEMGEHSTSLRRRLWFHFFCGIYLSYYLTRHRFDAIHAHFATASTIALVTHLFGGMPFFFTIHANEMYSGPILFEPKMQYARRVITNNSYNEKHINLLTSYRYRDKIVVIYNGLDLKQFENAQAKTQRSDPMRLVSIGSFTGFKGYPTVLKALHTLKQEGLAFSYVIIGGGRREEQEMIEKLVQEYELGQNVVLLGRQPFTRVRQEIEKADLEIMASEIFDRGIRDGFPNVIIEAMLLKRPVVTTYVSDIPSIVKHGKTGYLFPEKNADDLVNILRHLYHHYEDTLTVVTQAHRVAMQMFDAQKNYEVLTQILRGERDGAW